MAETLSAEERARYSRHLLLPEVGLEGQERLRRSSVLCVGAGGLGSPVLLYLAAAGVGRIGIIDFDRVDASNLQRQVLYGTSMIGRAKVDVAAERLKELNPHTHVDTWNEPITTENALDIIGAFDVVVDGTDNFPTRYLVNDACVLTGRPYIYGSIFKFEGHVSVFNYRGGPNYRDLYPEPPPPGSVPSCGEAGVLGVLPGVIGALQATEALKVLLDKDGTLSGRLLLYDALQMRFRELALQPDAQAAPITELINYTAFCAGDTMSQTHLISVAELLERRAAGWHPFVLDVRQPHEVDASALPFMDQNTPHDEVLSIAETLPRDRDIVVSCRSGGRSAMACRALHAAAPELRLFDLEGGILAWERAQP